jgi:hypothetical protein
MIFMLSNSSTTTSVLRVFQLVLMSKELKRRINDCGVISVIDLMRSSETQCASLSLKMIQSVSDGARHGAGRGLDNPNKNNLNPPIPPNSFGDPGDLSY